MSGPSTAAGRLAARAAAHRAASQQPAEVEAKPPVSAAAAAAIAAAQSVPLETRFWHAAAAVLPAWVLPPPLANESLDTSNENPTNNPFLLPWSTLLANLYEGRHSVESQQTAAEEAASVPPQEEAAERPRSRRPSGGVRVAEAEVNEGPAQEEDGMAVEADALLLLFLHFSSFSWHSGELVCRRLREPGWLLAIQVSKGKAQESNAIKQIQQA